MIPEGRFSESNQKTIVRLLSLIALLLTIYLLKALAAVLLPLVCSLFITMLLFPLYQSLRQRWGKKWEWLSLTVTMLVFLMALVLLAGVLWFCFHLVSSKIPEYAPLFHEARRGVLDWAQANYLPITEEMLRGSGMGERALAWITLLITSAWSIVGFLVLLFFLVLLMLLEWKEWKDKAHRSLRYKRMIVVMDTVDVVGQKFRHYLLIRTVISLISGVVEGLWIWIMGIDFAFLWGFLCFLLNYIPNIGSVIAVSLPIAVAVLQRGPGKAMTALAGLLVLEQIIGNFIDPRVQGTALRVSPTVVLVSLLFWGWMWGVLGALLAVPLTVSIIIVCAHVESLKPFGLLLSRSTDMQDFLEDTHNNSADPSLILKQKSKG